MCPASVLDQIPNSLACRIATCDCHWTAIGLHTQPLAELLTRFDFSLSKHQFGLVKISQNHLNANHLIQNFSWSKLDTFRAHWIGGGGPQQ